MLIHKGLEDGRWFKFSTAEQMANIGCDINRAIRWKNKGKLELSKSAFYRALELFDFTIADPKNNGGRLKEILRMREAFAGFYLDDNLYNIDEQMLHDYFMYFNYIAAAEKGK